MNIIKVLILFFIQISGLTLSNIFIDSMVKRLNLHKIIHTEDNLGFNDWSIKNGYKCGPQSHPLEAAHKFWADKFCNFIN